MANKLNTILGITTGLKRLANMVGYQLENEAGVKSKILWLQIKTTENKNFDMAVHVMPVITAWLEYAESVAQSGEGTDNQQTISE